MAKIEVVNKQDLPNFNDSRVPRTDWLPILQQLKQDNGLKIICNNNLEATNKRNSLMGTIQRGDKYLEFHGNIITTIRNNILYVKLKDK